MSGGAVKRQPRKGDAMIRCTHHFCGASLDGVLGLVGDASTFIWVLACRACCLDAERRYASGDPNADVPVQGDAVVLTKDDARAVADIIRDCANVQEAPSAVPQ